MVIHFYIVYGFNMTSEILVMYIYISLAVISNDEYLNIVIK